LVLSLVQIPNSIVDFFFPSRCLGCGRWGDLICKDCFLDLPRIMPPLCSKCGKPESSGGLCPGCWSSQSVIDGIRSVFRFEGTIRKAIHHLKYYQLKTISKDLALVLYDYIKLNKLNYEIIVPVPLHRKRLRQRGYNQSSLIANELGKLCNTLVKTESLFRVKDGIPQTRTSRVQQRRKNVANAFVCSDQYIDNKNVMLIDDVCTSGATLEACATALKAAGAASIWGLTVAREI
jgi:ComF family protein